MKFRPAYLSALAVLVAACGTLDSEKPGTGSATERTQLADPSPVPAETPGDETDEGGEVVDDEGEGCAVDVECGGDVYDPCAGKICGESCTLCAPGDGDCFETAVLKTCDASGSCTMGQAGCR